MASKRGKKWWMKKYDLDLDAKARGYDISDLPPQSP